MKHTINLKRVYSDPSGTPSDGFRVLVDRLWPRGESKAKFHYDLWAKEISPSTDLRQWYHADTQSRWDGFVEKYKQELAANPATSSFIAQLEPYPVLTLMYASHDTVHNEAVVLKEYLEDKLNS